MTMTVMEQEALETPEVVVRQYQENASEWEALAKRLRTTNVPFAMTIARGSSDHAATFAKYLLEVHCGLPTVSAAPSVVTIYQAKMQLKNSLVIGISQSGQSPDICAMMALARQQGAITVALVNHADSRLAEIAEFVIPLWAGEEKAVAATKSYLGTLAALIQFIAYYQQNPGLMQALPQLPDCLQEATEMDWSRAVQAYQPADATFIIGRGYSYPIAQEAALKLKETSAIHAEAFSSAEVLHGPFALVRPEYPMLLFTQTDQTLKGALSLADRSTALGAKVLMAIPANIEPEVNVEAVLPLPVSRHALFDPLMGVQAFYRMAAQLSVAKGLDPDKPKNLRKVTETH